MWGDADTSNSWEQLNLRLEYKGEEWGSQNLVRGAAREGRPEELWSRKGLATAKTTVPS